MRAPSNRKTDVAKFGLDLDLRPTRIKVQRVLHRGDAAIQGRVSASTPAPAALSGAIAARLAPDFPARESSCLD